MSIAACRLLRFTPGQTSGVTDYSRHLGQAWDSESTIVNVEHDMELSSQLVDELAQCPHPLCTHAYLLYFPTTHQHEPHYAHNVSLSGWQPPIDDISRYTARGIRWIGGGEEWADFSGIGFCKITASARIGPLAEAHWRWAEMSVHAAIRGRWHVHWPGVEHYHTGVPLQ